MSKILKKGFSLLELILVLGIGTMVTFMKFQDMRNEQENLLASTTGQQIKQMGEAVNGYINIRYDKLAALTNAAGNGTDPGPRTCSATVCEITYQTLVNEGLLPSAYTGINANKSPYKILLRRDGSAPNYVINGMITTAMAWVENTNVRYDLLGKAMQSAGIDSGMTKSATIASGYGLQWTENSTKFNNITSSGQLAYRVGYNSALYSIYLRRDGTLPMTGNLNMGGNDINNAKDINGTGNLNIGANAAIGNNLTVKGTIATNNYSISNIPVGWTGGIRTQDIYASGTFGIGGNDARLKGYITYNGPQDKAFIFSNGYVGVGVPSAAGNSEGTYNAYLSNENGKGVIYASGNIEGDTLQVDSINSIGASCTAGGLISKDNAGNIISCISGVWQPIGDQPGTIKMWGTTTAPQGWLELNGQIFDKVQNPILAALYPTGRVPDLRGQFVRAWDHGAGNDPDSSRGILSTQGDAMRNLTGKVYGIAHFVGAGGTGVFQEVRRPTWTKIDSAPPGEGSTTNDLDIDASRQVPTAPENRPKNIALMYIMKKG